MVRVKKQHTANDNAVYDRELILNFFSLWHEMFQIFG